MVTRFRDSNCVSLPLLQHCVLGFVASVACLASFSGLLLLIWAFHFCCVLQLQLALQWFQPNSWSLWNYYCFHQLKHMYLLMSYRYYTLTQKIICQIYLTILSYLESPPEAISLDNGLEVSELSRPPIDNRQWKIISPTLIRSCLKKRIFIS